MVSMEVSHTNRGILSGWSMICKRKKIITRLEYYSSHLFKSLNWKQPWTFLYSHHWCVIFKLKTVLWPWKPAFWSSLWHHNWTLLTVSSCSVSGSFCVRFILSLKLRITSPVSNCFRMMHINGLTNISAILLSHRNQLLDFQCKLPNWFLYEVNTDMVWFNNDCSHPEKLSLLLWETSIFTTISPLVH